MSDVTYTPAAYWHRLDDEITEPRQTVTVTVEPEAPDQWVRPQRTSSRPYQRKPRKQQPAPNLDWSGLPFPEAGR